MSQEVGKDDETDDELKEFNVKDSFKIQRWVGFYWKKIVVGTGRLFIPVKVWFLSFTENSLGHGKMAWLTVVFH